MRPASLSMLFSEMWLKVYAVQAIMDSRILESWSLDKQIITYECSNTAKVTLNWIKFFLCHKSNVPVS